MIFIADILNRFANGEKLCDLYSEVTNDLVNLDKDDLEEFKILTAQKQYLEKLMISIYMHDNQYTSTRFSEGRCWYKSDYVDELAFNEFIEEDGYIDSFLYDEFIEIENSISRLEHKSSDSISNNKLSELKNKRNALAVKIVTLSVENDNYFKDETLGYPVWVKANPLW